MATLEQRQSIGNDGNLGSRSHLLIPVTDRPLSIERDIEEFLTGRLENDDASNAQYQQSSVCN